jgi:hypothetical protein
MRAHADAMSTARPAWRPLIAGTVGLFLVILAFLAGQLHAGGDPSVGSRGTPATERIAPQTTQPTVPGIAPPVDSGVPDQGGGTDDMTPSSGPPATHQS